ncbi:AAA family ATPase [Cellulosimicrobium protaetiae]|uniref:AAA family ATPase n=1 Tax=Cellulosimicrobium protaetiae TaxID=2587808 RepID=A0A6M5UCV4_9MICO|nr:AAA family ATPase [Cellulosimicrobium protaetiae]QJW36050.1 AAA family ATPase [Cellulosimicrobium protaetiae]
MLATIAVEGYRSLRGLVLPLGRLTVVTGANGTGKSSLYRALRLLAGCALGGAVGAVAREGGLRSTLWAGPEHGGGRAVRDGGAVQGTRRTAPVALRLGFAGAAPSDLGYAVDLGLPQHPGSAFGLDPEIKVESIWSGPVPRPAALQVERRGPAVRVRDDSGGWVSSPARLRSFDSVLTELVDPVGAPEVVAVREALRSWRFYDQLRTDAAAPARAPQVGTRTPVLAHDGADLAAALETVRDLGRGDELDDAVSRAFPGSRLAVHADDGRFEIALHQDGLLRPLTAAELSDGTLRYLFLVAALLSPRPPELLVLNEPETSLHPDLLPALGALVHAAARETQVVVVTHATPLVEALRDATAAGTRDLPGSDDLQEVELVRSPFGETTVAGREGLLDQPPWTWPRR